MKYIQQQQAETVRILSELAEELREQEKAHREQFCHMKLADTFHTVGYAFEKLFSELREGPPIVQNCAVEHLQKALDDFEKLLGERGLTLDSYDSVRYRYDEIKHPIAELTKFIKGEQSEIRSNQSARVFAEALRVHFDCLRDVACEIDREYTSEPDPVNGSPTA